MQFDKYRLLHERSMISFIRKLCLFNFFSKFEECACDQTQVTKTLVSQIFLLFIMKHRLLCQNNKKPFNIRLTFSIILGILCV